MPVDARLNEISVVAWSQQLFFFMALAGECWIVVEPRYSKQVDFSCISLCAEYASLLGTYLLSMSSLMSLFYVKSRTFPMSMFHQKK